MEKNKSDIHVSYHSGTNEIYRDYSGVTGTIHDHGSAGKRWDDNPDAGGKSLYSDGDGGWKYADGTNYKPGG